MLADFLIRALAAGTLIAFLFGILGSFVVWRRMSYFGDAVSHSSILGVWLGLLLGWSINFSMILACVLFGVFLIFLGRRGLLSNDVLIGVLSHSFFSVGLLAIYLSDLQSFDLHGFLFGHILLLSWQDVQILFVLLMVVVICVASFWARLILITIDRDLALAEGLRVDVYQFILMLLLSASIGISVSMLGAFLVTSVLILPAASARFVSSSPFGMVCWSIFFAGVALLLGILISFLLDLLLSPTVVLVAFMEFLLCAFVFARKR